MKLKTISLIMVFVLLLTACSNGGDASSVPGPGPGGDPFGEVTDTPTLDPVLDTTPVFTPTPIPSPEPTPAYSGPVNPLTGLPIEESAVNDRPIAVVMNNLKQALPQVGISQADIIYEVLAEGGITRMIAIYQSVEDVGLIGSIRSSRTYFLELVLGHDAILLYAGGSPDAYDKIKAWNVTSLDCVNGPYEGSLYWRDKSRIKINGYVHSVVTSGEKILELFPKYNIRKEVNEDFRYEMQFAEDGTPKNGQQALTIEVPYSYYKTGLFTYDASSGKYLVEEYGEAYIDGNTNEQVSVTNVIVLQTKCSLIPGDDAGRLDVDLTEGEGWYACGGKIIPIHWSKGDVNSQFVYTTEDGEPLILGTGTSYVNIIPLENEITIK